MVSSGPTRGRQTAVARHHRIDRAGNRDRIEPRSPGSLGKNTRPDEQCPDPECGLWIRQDHLDRHIETVHGTKPRATAPCFFCNYQCTDSTRCGHIQSHHLPTNKAACKYCRFYWPKPRSRINHGLYCPAGDRSGSWIYDSELKLYVRKGVHHSSYENYIKKARVREAEIEEERKDKTRRSPSSSALPDSSAPTTHQTLAATIRALESRHPTNNEALPQPQQFSTTPVHSRFADLRAVPSTSFNFAEDPSPGSFAAQDSTRSQITQVVQAHVPSPKSNSAQNSAYASQARSSPTLPPPSLSNRPTLRLSHSFNSPPASPLIDPVDKHYFGGAESEPSVPPPRSTTPEQPPTSPHNLSAFFDFEDYYRSLEKPSLSHRRARFYFD